MNDRVQHYSRKGQTLSPIRPSQEFPNFRACLWCPIHQTDLWSFCSTYEPTEFPSISSEGKHSPRYDRAKSFPISVRAFSVPIHQTDLVSFCSSNEPTEFPSISSEGKHSPRYDRAKSFPISCVPLVSPYTKTTYGVFALPASR